MSKPAPSVIEQAKALAAEIERLRRVERAVHRMCDRLRVLPAREAEDRIKLLEAEIKKGG